MSDDMVNRNPKNMEEFADELSSYCSQMNTACKKLQSSLSNAESGMKDDFSKEALKRVEEIIEELLTGLPEVQKTEEMLREAAKPLKEASNLTAR